MSAKEDKILVWDLPTRLGHWLMAGGFALAWLTAESETWRLVHVAAGSTVVAVALFRLFWGFIGTRHARYENFVRSPQAAWRYLKSLLSSTPHHHTGHNPAGGWAILALLSLALLAGTTGWLNYQEIGGDWLEELHEGLAATMLAVVFVHLGGVLVGSLAHRENLARAMITGRKSGPVRDAIANLRPLAAAALVGWTVTVAWLLAR
jgi:cytochrome b